LLNGTTDLSGKPVTLSADATVDVNGNAINFANAIGGAGAGALTVKSTIAGGSLTLAGNNTYTGNTTVNSGSLLVNGSINNGVVAVQTGATLGGTGIIGVATTCNAGATLTPGVQGIGTLSIGSLTLNATSTNSFVVTSTGGASNKVVVANLLTPNSSVIRVKSGTALTPSTNTLFTYGSISGAFNPTVVFDVAPVHPSTLLDTGSQIQLVVPNQAPVAVNVSMGAESGTAASLRIIGDKYSPTDADGDSVTVSAVQTTSAQGGTVTMTSTNVTYTSASGFTGTDTFTYTVSDPYGATSTATVTVSVSGNNQGQGYNQLNAQAINGQAVLTYLGIPGLNYALDWTHDLTPPVIWTPVMTNAAASNGYLMFTNTPSGGSDFYRTRYVP